MAYMSQDHKKEIAANVKPILKKYGVTGTLSVKNHSTICLNISKGSIDFFGENTEKRNMQVNPYHYEKHFTGKALDFLKEVVPLLFGEHYFDKSDSMVDYFDCSHYVEVNVGRWNKDYVLLDK